jgi:hypothetical protein
VRGSTFDRPFWQLALYAIGVVFAVVMMVRWTHHRNSTIDAADAASTAVISADAPASAAPPQLQRATPVNSQRLLAECQPHLGPNQDFVPNLDMSHVYNPSIQKLRVRFWVNGDGFTSNPFIDGAVNGMVPGDQVAALDFVRHLTFEVPNTAQCRERHMEMIGYFLESMDAGGQWTTLFDVHPRLYIENGVLVNRPQ